MENPQDLRQHHHSPSSTSSNSGKQLGSASRDTPKQPVDGNKAFMRAKTLEKCQEWNTGDSTATLTPCSPALAMLPSKAGTFLALFSIFRSLSEMALPLHADVEKLEGIQREAEKKND